MKCAMVLILSLFSMGGSVYGQSCHSMSALKQFIGQWAQETEAELTTEIWRQVSDKTYEGVGEGLDKTGNIQTRETLRLVEMSGDIFYIAKVRQNENPIPFKLTACTLSRFVFENPQHDFPKKLVYKFINSDKLHVTVSGEDENEFQIFFDRKNIGE